MRRAGVDIGGTKCLGVVVDGTGSVVAEERLATPYGHEALLETVSELAGELSPFDTLGVGAAGLVTREGVWRAAPNVGGVSDFRIGSELSERLGQRVEVDNDAM